MNRKSILVQHHHCTHSPTFVHALEVDSVEIHKKDELNGCTLNSIYVHILKRRRIKKKPYSKHNANKYTHKMQRMTDILERN